ncbi:helix-turn-helix transcriptional regulator [Aestuariibaculum sediminum]|uniref:Helix-turn-helix transcriptional regulator n=1 Tax=Aestuariibaculum sediminum TaxID=2770637 RepID=A0A8J6UBW3_9FLAO|nr:AraC family transcriptional regulator [Aestuariibaculum sediminum]MBD0831509.1 helix-turn-helix transcriptional regulator [Aestuariibaculum sediminum]
MTDLENRKRLENIFNHLIKMSSGNFSYRLERTNKTDELEALTALVNGTSEEIQDAFFHQSYINLHDSYRFASQMFFLLDEQFNIMELNSSPSKFLEYHTEDLLNNPFESFLSDNSKKTWGKTLKLKSSKKHEKNILLEFKTKTNLLLPSYCKVIFFSNASFLKGKTIITSFDFIQARKIIEEKLERKINQSNDTTKANKSNKKALSFTDVAIIRAIGEHLNTRLQLPLPNLKDLAHEFGTNEFKLKKGFKELYGMTASKYLKNQRLRKAHVLIADTNKSIKTIAKMVGLKRGNHLSREFKERFGYSPTKLRSKTK